MSTFALSKHITGTTKKLLWRVSLSRSIHENPKAAENVDDRLNSDLVRCSPNSQEGIANHGRPITLEKNPYEKERVKCILCTHNIVPDYKNVRLLSQFQSRYTGRIYGRHITGLCTAKQKKVESEILKAQNAGLMGYYFKEVTYAKDPALFDPDNPFRPHKY